MKAKNSSDIHVLLADQDVVLCVSARRALQRIGFAVTLAHEGNDVLDRFAQASFDVVVIGAALPGRNSLQVLREIKQRRRDTPVILLGDPASEVSKDAERDGAFAYLALPAEGFEELISTIDRALLLRKSPEPTPPALSAPVVFGHFAFDESMLVSSLCEMIECSRSKPLADAMPLLLRASATALNAEHSVVLLAQTETDLQLDSALGFSDQAAAARDFVRHVGDAFAWRVATERRTLIDQAPASEGQAAFQFIGTPLVAHEQLLGVLVIYPLTHESIEPARVAWLETFAAQGALTIQLAQLDAKIKRILPNDPLTGVLKRGDLIDSADHEFRRSWRYHQPISGIIVDVDNMREINVASGKEFGDRVLREVANACRSIVRSIDLVGRYENDAFAILLLMTDHHGAKSVAERLRLGIASINLSDERGPVRVTATLGVCSYPRDNCASIFDLLAVSLEAQRAARRSGANEIVYA